MVRDKSRLVTDGNGGRSISLQFFKPRPTKRVFEGPEDLSLGISCRRDGVGPEEFRLPARRKIKGYLSFPVREFKAGRHCVTRSLSENRGPREAEKG